MAPIKLTIHRVGTGQCSLTGKEGEGLAVTFDDGTLTDRFVLWKSLKQLLSLKTGQQNRPVASPAATVTNGAVGVGK